MRKTPSQLSEQEKQAVLKDWNDCQLTSYEIANKYNLARSSLKDFIKREGGIDRKRITTNPKIVEEEENLGQIHRHNLEIEKIKSQVRHYRRLYQESLTVKSTQDVLVDLLKDTISAIPVMSPEPITIPTGIKSHGLHTCGAILSDLHAGEVVDPDVMMGLGGYNTEILRQRAGVYVNRFLRLLEIERSANEIPRLTLLLDGDFISGLIHEELLKTNDVNIMEQTTTVSNIVAWIIAQISIHFENVHVSCTVGNHGRNQSKIEFKEPYVNWDYICYQLIAMLLRNYDNITWDIPKSIWALTKIEKLTFFHYHGHGKIYNSLSIPYYGIERAVREFREIFQAHDLAFDAITMGHFHHFFERDLGTGPIIINPSWKGGDEFATLGLRKWSRASQVMFFVHSTHGYLHSKMIHLDGNTKKDAEGVPNKISPIWVDENI